MTDLQMCAFPPLGEPVKTVLTDRRYYVLWIEDETPTQQWCDTLPEAWDAARIHYARGVVPTIWGRFGGSRTDDVLYADWSNTY